MDRRLKTVRKRAISQLEEELLIKELLRIIYNRIGLYDQKCFTFATVFLRQSGLQFGEKLAIDEYHSFQKQKTFKYKPHLKLIIKSVKFIGDMANKFGSNVNKEIELTIITSIDGLRKQKKTIRMKESLLTSGNQLSIDCQFIHPLIPKSDTLLIGLCLSPSPQNITKYLCGLFQNNKICAKDIRIEPLRSMPLTGLHNSRYSTDLDIKGSTSTSRAEVELKLEFTDDPKLIRKFGSEKAKSHKNLLTKLYNRWPTDGIPSEMKALIEMNRQQNGLTFEENCILEENVLTEIKELSEANKQYKQFLRLINRAPDPGSDFGSDHFNANNNNNNSGSVPPIHDEKVFRLFRNGRNKVEESLPDD